MSKIGKVPISIPEGVKVLLENKSVEVSGPKGTLNLKLPKLIKAVLKDKNIEVTRDNDSEKARSLHGLFRSLIANMVQGVCQGYFKTLELSGTGFRASLESGNLKLIVGFSHPVIVKPGKGISFEVKDNIIIKVLGADKYLVGQTAASLRKIKPPDDYKGKGIRYQGEVIKLKPGKAAKVGQASEG